MSLLRMCLHNLMSIDDNWHWILISDDSDSIAAHKHNNNALSLIKNNPNLAFSD